MISISRRNSETLIICLLAIMLTFGCGDDGGEKSKVSVEKSSEYACIPEIDKVKICEYSFSPDEIPLGGTFQQIVVRSIGFVAEITEYCVETAIIWEDLREENLDVFSTCDPIQDLPPSALKEEEEFSKGVIQKITTNQDSRSILWRGNWGVMYVTFWYIYNDGKKSNKVTARLKISEE